MENNRKIEWIDDYLDNLLTHDEKEKFERLLKSDEAFSQLFSLVKFTRESVKLHGQKEKISEIQREFLTKRKKNSTKSNTVPLSWWFGIAASISLLAFIGFISLSGYSTDLYQNKYYAYEIPTMRSSISETLAQETFYQNREWDKLRSQGNLDSEDRYAVFLTGLSYLETQDFLTALQYFDRTFQINLNSGDQIFNDELDYYRSISYVGLSDYESAYQLVKKIKSDKDHTYHRVFSGSDLLKMNLLRFFKKNIEEKGYKFTN